MTGMSHNTTCMSMSSMRTQRDRSGYFRVMCWRRKEGKMREGEGEEGAKWIYLAAHVYLKSFMTVVLPGSWIQYSTWHTESPINHETFLHQAHYSAWHTILHGTLFYMAHYSAWHTILHCTLLYMTHYSTWQTTLYGTLLYMAHYSTAVAALSLTLKWG